MKSKKCLMIKTKDSRKFFTYKKNMPLLTEFSKIFDAEISIVKVDESTLLDIDELPSVICDSDYKSDVKYEIVENKKNRKDLLKLSKKIDDFIYKKLLQYKPLSLQDVKERFSKYNLSDSCLSHHLHQALEKLKQEEKKIIKISHGKYQLDKKI